MSRVRHWLIMVVLSISGGIIFLLPFLQEVYYKPIAEEQGKAFGILETGRGLGEVLSSTALLAVFAALGSSNYALSVVISLFSALILALGVVASLAVFAMRGIYFALLEDGLGLAASMTIYLKFVKKPADNG